MPYKYIHQTDYWNQPKWYTRYLWKVRDQMLLTISLCLDVITVSKCHFYKNHQAVFHSPPHAHIIWIMNELRIRWTLYPQQHKNSEKMKEVLGNFFGANHIWVTGHIDEPPRTSPEVEGDWATLQLPWCAPVSGSMNTACSMKARRQIVLLSGQGFV